MRSLKENQVLTPEPTLLTVLLHCLQQLATADLALNNFHTYRPFDRVKRAPRYVASKASNTFKFTLIQPPDVTVCHRGKPNIAIS